MTSAEAHRPLYAQLERSLVAAISKGRYRVGDQLPTEAELCERHGVSRHTVRAALRRIQDLGMIERRTSAGTRVISAQPIDDYQPLATSPADILSLVEQTRIAHPESGEIKADRLLARRLRCRAGTTWFRLAGARLRRTGDKQPLCFSEQFLRPDLDPTPLIRGDFVLDELRGQRIEQEITADVIDEHLAGALDAKTGSPAIVIIRRHFEKARLISVGIHTHPTDRFSIRTELSRTPG